MAEPESIDIEKTGPIRLLESRRAALIQWLREGQDEIAASEAAIHKNKEEAVEMMAEIDEIETALTALHAAHRAAKEQADGG